MFQSDCMSYPWNLKIILKYSPKQAKRNLQFMLTKRKTVITVSRAPSVLSPWGASYKCIREYSIYVLEGALMKTNKTRVYPLPSAIEISSHVWNTTKRHQFTVWVQWWTLHTSPEFFSRQFVGHAWLYVAWVEMSHSRLWQDYLSSPTFKVDKILLARFLYGSYFQLLKTRKFDFWWFFLPWQMLGIVHLISVRSWASLNFFHNSAVIPQIPSIFHLLHLTVVTPYLIQSPLSSFLYHSHRVLRPLPSCLTYDSVDSLLRSAWW